MSEIYKEVRCYETARLRGRGGGWGKTQTVKLVNLICPSENDGTETES